jgi:hypothetical protein
MSSSFRKLRKLVSTKKIRTTARLCLHNDKENRFNHKFGTKWGQCLCLLDIRLVTQLEYVVANHEAARAKSGS